MWKYNRFHKIPRVTIAVIFSFVFMFELAVAFADTPTDQATSNPSAPAISQNSESNKLPEQDGSQPEQENDSAVTNDSDQDSITQIADQQDSSDPETTTTAAPASAPVSGSLKVHFIDVGQADAILIQAPSGKSMLIDAGNNGDGPGVVSYIKNQGISKLDLVVGTHPHEDHIGGLDNVINSLSVGQVVMPNKTHTTQTYKDVLSAVQNKGLKITAAKAGVNLDLGQGITTKVIAPTTSYDDLNNNSAVIYLTYGNTSFLFTGDAEKDAEADILADGYNIKANVLKVGHHGSATSSSQSFLNKVKPQHAIIMVGQGNDYGHPEQETLTRLTNIGAKVYRTDINGTIIATSDGSSVYVSASPVKIEPSTQQEQSSAPPVSSTVQPELNEPAPEESSQQVTAGDENIVVYKTKTGEKYHADGCSSLSRSKIEITLEKAKELGLGPCDKCNPPQ